MTCPSPNNSVPSPATCPPRAALYCRVSTSRQAEADLSIPDQIRQGEEHCQRRGWTLAATYIEPGLSATDDNRPELLRMMEAATSPGRPYDIVLVHSMSRLFRDQLLLEVYYRRLAKACVQVQSVTQEINDDPTGQLIRQILGSFDQYQSAETAKHTLRAMQENARQGFWNGSLPPYGYRVVDGEKRGTKVKKLLAIDEAEAPVVREIFEFALGGRGLPLGIKAIVNRLNVSGPRFRGKPWHIAGVHRILTSRTYTGLHHFNRRSSKTGRVKDAAEWIAVQVPKLIEEVDFDLVQASLASRNPKRTPPRVVSSPTLLTGLAICGTCSAGMTLRTGKSGRYRYYTCAGCAQKGKSVCPGRSISMPKLDTLVLDHLAQRLFTQERLSQILAGYAARSQEDASAATAHLAQARKAVTEAEGRIERLLTLVEQGDLAADDPAMRQRLAAARLARREAEERVKQLEAMGRQGTPIITAAKIERLGSAVREALAKDDPSYRKAYLRLFVDQVVVRDNEIRLRGPTAQLVKAAANGEVPPAAMVPSFVQKWRPRRETTPLAKRPDNPLRG